MISSLITVLTKKERVTIIVALILFVLSGVSKASIYIKDNTDIVPSRGGEYTEGMVRQPVVINPVVQMGDVDQSLSKLIFSSVSDLAETIKSSGGGKVWTVRLKENLYWSDGEKLTSDDVIFTLETIADETTESPLYPTFQGIVADRVSQLEIKFTLPGPYAFFDTDHLKNLQIIPKHIFQDIPAQNIKLSKYSLRPIGSGPYKIISYKQDETGFINSFELQENDKYSGERPNISKLIFKFYKNNEGLIEGYNSGQINGFGLNTSSDLSEIKIRNEINYFNSPRYYAIFINQVSGPKEFKDYKVRSALNKLVDRERISKDVFREHGKILFGPTEFTSNPSSQYDTKYIQGLTLNLIVPDEPFLTDIGNIVKENWESTGAIVNLKVLSPKSIKEDILRNNNYDLLLFGNIVKEDYDLFSFWHSSRRFYPGQNLSLYQNIKVDSLLEAYRRNFDPESRKNILGNISDLISSDLPAIFLYSPSYVYVSYPGLRGFDKDKLISVPSDRFSDIAKWYVNTSRVFK